MSGQPVKTVSDQNKFRNKYLQTLSLQEKNNDYNLQANKNYLLTGQLPPSSQMQDTRTNAEKLADVEKLKIETASALKPIAESDLAYNIINKIMNSPLNVDNTLFRFFAQRVTNIVEQLKKIMPYGIAGDANDVETTVNFIKNMYSEQQGKFQSTKSYLNSTQSQGTNSKVIGGNDIDFVIEGLKDIYKNLEILKQRGVNVGGVANMDNDLLRLTDAITRLKNALPTTEQIKLLMEELDNIDPGIPTLYNRTDLEAFYTMIEKLPKYNEVMTLINKINQYIRNNNLNLVADGINNLLKLFSDVLGIPANIMLQFANIKARQQFKQDEKQKLNSEQTRDFIRNQTNENRNISKAQKVYIINPEDDAVWTRPGILNPAPAPPGGIPAPPGGIPAPPGGIPAPPVPPPAGGIPAPPPAGGIPVPPPVPPGGIPPPPPPAPRNQPERAQPPGAGPSYLPGAFPPGPNPFVGVNFVGPPGINIPYLRQFTDDQLNYIIDKILVTYPNMQYGIVNGLNNAKTRNRFSKIGAIGQALADPREKGNVGENITWRIGDLGIAGLGLKKRGRPRGSGIAKPTLIKPKTFIGFGINEINNKQLENGIVKIRRNTKTNYVDMPSRRVSKNLQGILKTIVGGGMPKYDELGKLDEEEKEYLNKIVSRSDLTDRLSIPAPSKDQQEKDIHNFEVMKGQIMSGNDSKEMVRKFKLLIRKLSKQQLLPKADVEDLLDILGDLGY